MTYTGILFKRILIHSGYTHNRKYPVTTTRLSVRYKEYRTENYDNKPEFIKTLKWLESEGYIKINWKQRCHITRNTCGITDYIRITEKGYAIANKYI